VGVREEKETASTGRKRRRRELTNIIGGGRDRWPRRQAIRRKRCGVGKKVKEEVGEEAAAEAMLLGGEECV
jgi:hypothetical protein